MSKYRTLLVLILGMLLVWLAWPAIGARPARDLRRGQPCEGDAGPAGPDCVPQPAADGSRRIAPLTTTAEVDQTGYVKGLYVSYHALSSPELMAHVRSLLETTELNAIVMDFKGDRGYLSFPTQVPLARQIGADQAPVVQDPATFLAWYHERNIYTIARIVAFKDDLLATAHPEWAAVDSATGRIWKDGEGLGWADPAHPEVHAYNVALGVEAARLGFDEIQYDYVRFPSDGAVARARFAAPNTQANRIAAIASFLAKARAALAPLGKRLAADVFGYVTVMDNDLGIGQHIEAMAPHLDVLSPMVYPSTYSSGLPDNPAYRNAVAFPYEIVYESTRRAVARARAVNPAIQVRPWLQDFRDYAFDGRVYTAGEIRRQMDGAREAGGRGWLLWDAAVQYTPEALVSARPRFAPNPQGQVLVLRYERIGSPESADQRTPENLRGDLERFLAGGYYPVTLRELTEGRLAMVPAGKRPIVLTFDGSTPDQFRILPGGALDPNTAVGVLKAFHDAHPADWPLRATFFVAPDVDGTGDPIFGTRDIEALKLSLLARWGIEVGLYARDLGDLLLLGPDAVRQALGLRVAHLRKLLPDNPPVFLAVPQNLPLLNPSLVAQGEAEGTRYAFQAIVGAELGLAPSPTSARFDPLRIPRVPATQDQLHQWLAMADLPGVCYVSGGE